MCNLAVNLYEITRTGQSAIAEEDVGVEDIEDKEPHPGRTGRASNLTKRKHEGRV